MIFTIFRRLGMYLSLITILILFVVCRAQAQSNYKLKSFKGNIKGTSTLHDWESDITKIEYKDDLSPKGITPETLKNVEIKIPVESIKSHEGKIMDHKTYEAFKSEENPFIIFSFPSANVQTDAMQNVTIAASGNLAMAGTTKPVILKAKGKVLPNGDVQLFISHKIKMTDFNMKPPVAMLGTITVGDETTVNFELLLSNTK